MENNVQVSTGRSAPVHTDLDVTFAVECSPQCFLLLPLRQLLLPLLLLLLILLPVRRVTSNVKVHYRHLLHWSLSRSCPKENYAKEEGKKRKGKKQSAKS